MKKCFFLILSIFSVFNLKSQSINNISLSLGPNFLFPKESKAIGNGSFIELHTSIKLTKRSALIYGIGFSKNYWKKEFDIDPTFQYIQSVNGCNCGLYSISHNISILSFPFLYRFTIFKNHFFTINFLGGIESTYTIKNEFNYSKYFRRKDGTLDLRPYNYRESQTDTYNCEFFTLFQRKLQLETIFKLRKHIYLTSELSFIFAEQFRVLRFGFGLQFAK